MLPRNIRKKNASCALMTNDNETNELPIALHSHLYALGNVTESDIKASV